MDKRYQVFVSSTYNDLKDERSEVMQALLELECMPAGMELFPAANETQWSWIKKVIDESDYYIVIIGGMYGSIAKDVGLSYTEKEYRYAVEAGKPVIGFLHEDPSKLPAKLTEQSPQKKKQLNAFRELVRTRLCKLYANPSDLGAKVSRSLTQLKKQYPAVGWIRADAFGLTGSAEEILRLREMNDHLSSQIVMLTREPPENAKNLSSGTDLVQLDFCFTRKKRAENGKSWKKVSDEWDVLEITWDTIFAQLAPPLIKRNSSRYYLHSPLLDLIKSETTETLELKYPNERFTDFDLSTECWNMIWMQFRALNMVRYADGGWELTGYGNNYLTNLLAVRKGEKRSRR